MIEFDPEDWLLEGFVIGPQFEHADFTTVQRLDSPVPPGITCQDDFFEFLFSGQDVPYSELKAKAADQKALPLFSLKDVRITVDLDADYGVVRTQLTRNVVGVIDGKDARLKGLRICVLGTFPELARTREPAGR